MKVCCHKAGGGGGGGGGGGSSPPAPYCYIPFSIKNKNAHVLPLHV